MFSIFKKFSVIVDQTRNRNNTTMRAVDNLKSKLAVSFEWLKQKKNLEVMRGKLLFE